MELSTQNSSSNTFSKLANLIKNEKNREAKSLLENSDSCELVNEFGTTLLHVASATGNESMTQYLLDKQLIDIDAQDQDGKTPIMFSLANLDHEENALTILEFKPNIYICDKFGRSTLQMALELHPCRFEFIDLFVDIVKVEFQYNYELIAWKLTNIGYSLRHAVFFQNSTITRIMLDCECDVNERDSKTGLTALHVSVELKDLENVKLLIEFGADVNAMDIYDKVPFFNYFYDNTDKELEILKILVERSTSLTTFEFNNGQFTTSVVMHVGNREALMVLLNSNMDFNANDMHNNIPLHYLMFNDEVLRDNPDIIEVIRSKVFDANATNSDGNSLLLMAANNGLDRMVELLINQGANTNMTNDNGMSPLYVAFAHRYGTTHYKKCIELLLEHEADPQIITDDGKTVFDCMVTNKNYYSLEPLCGQLAILEDCGTEISDFIRSKINAHQIFKDKFEACKLQLEQLKTVVIHESMSLYKILNDSHENIELYARNDDFFFELMEFNDRYSRNSYYCHLLKNHLDKPIKRAALRREIIDVLCEVMELNYHSNHIIIDKIIGYVKFEV